MKRIPVICSALVLLVVLASGPVALAAGGGAKEGWGPRGSWIGRYRVKVLTPGDSGVRGGELTMFIQEEFPGSEAPAGILKLTTKTNNDLVYLTELKHQGRARTATVTGGSFLGPRIGGFIGKLRPSGQIVADVKTRSLGTMQLLLTRFSKSPSP